MSDDGSKVGEPASDLETPDAGFEDLWFQGLFEVALGSAGNETKKQAC